MFTKIALSVAIVLGAASAALAGSKDDDGWAGGGFNVQTWQDIEQARQDIQRQIQSQYHTGNAGTAYAYVASPNQKHRPSHDRR